MRHSITYLRDALGCYGFKCSCGLQIEYKVLNPPHGMPAFKYDSYELDTAIRDHEYKHKREAIPLRGDESQVEKNCKRSDMTCINGYVCTMEGKCCFNCME